MKIRAKCTYDGNWHYIYETQDIINENITCPTHPEATVSDFIVIDNTIPFIEHLTWKVNPTYNGIINLLGWNIKTDTAVSLTSGSPITASESGYHNHFILDISSISGEPFTVRITGTSIDENDGTSIPSDTEDIAVTGNGYYQSSKSWIDAPQISIVESSKSCTVDIYRNTYWDRGNQNFTIVGSRLEFIPDADVWNLQFKIYKVNNNGSLTEIDNIIMSNTDTPLRASNGKLGKYKRGDYNQIIKGIEKEGIIVQVDQTNIEYFFLEVKHNG